MARLILSEGMLLALASAMMVRSRGFMSGSPPLRAATVSSLMMRVKSLPRLASAAPFLCLIVCHLEWPDIRKLPGKTRKKTADLNMPPGAGGSSLRRQDHPDVRARIPGAALVVPEHRVDAKPRALEVARHAGD